jgi:hypothetical protein
MILEVATLLLWAKNQGGLQCDRIQKVLICVDSSNTSGLLLYSESLDLSDFNVAAESLHNGASFLACGTTTLFVSTLADLIDSSASTSL